MVKKKITPKHIAVIMDGNGRWAKKRFLPRLAGHRKGADAVRKIVESASDNNIQYLTLFAFSTENWKRPESEVNGLMNMLKEFIVNEQASLIKKNIRFRVIGNRKKLPDDILKAIETCEQKTLQNTSLQLILALNYGGRDEIVHACRDIAQKVKDNLVLVEDIDEQSFMQSLYAPDIPDPDLLIRTSGELRISNFLIWECAYTEFVVLDKMWPDFNETDLKSCIAEYHKRSRKYGSVK